MRRLIVRRLALGLLTLWLVSVTVFLATDVLPGDVAQTILGQNADPQALQALRKELRLDQPPLVRYGSWLAAIVHGDLGISISSGRRLTELLHERLPYTLVMAAIAGAIATGLAVFLALVSVLGQGGALDRVIGGSMLVIISSPEFLLATVLVAVFAVKMSWFPTGAYFSGGAGWLSWAHALVLPVLTLVLVALAPLTRMIRSSLLNVMDTPAIEMALLKGLHPHRVILVHALANAWAPIINVIALNLSYIIGGVVVVEVVFSYPGMAKLMVDAVGYRDIPVVQACALVLCGIYVLLNLAADMMAILTNPRLSRGA